jgi:glutathione S-transferase
MGALYNDNGNCCQIGEKVKNGQPILYSFRRCPYAMRARMGVLLAGRSCELREVVLRDKPAEMLEVSAKATVPVLVLSDGKVIDESLDIMLWALANNDAADVLPSGEKAKAVFALIEKNDGPFKHHLDRYKYENRFEEAPPGFHRNQGATFLWKLNERLEKTAFLFGEKLSLADVAIFPFIRQFANTDRKWFDNQKFSALQRWLEGHLESDLFAAIMHKYPAWKPGDKAVVFANATGCSP